MECDSLGLSVTRRHLDMPRTSLYFRVIYVRQSCEGCQVFSFFERQGLL